MRFLICAVIVFFIAILLFQPANGFSQNLEIINYKLISKERVSRVEYDYTYKADITNRGAALTNVSATLTSSSPYTNVIDDSLSFGDVPTGASIESDDTFTIRQNRLYSFDWAMLDWDISFEISESRTLSVGPEGGELKFPNGVILDIPAGAVNESTAMTLTALPIDEVNAILSAKGYASHEKRYLGGFSAEPDVVFNVPIKAVVPILPLKPYEIPIQMEIDLDEQKYRITETNLKFLAEQKLAKIEISHFSGQAIGAISGIDPEKLDALCTDPFWNRLLKICEDYDELQPAYCLLAEAERPDDWVCCKEQTFSTKSAALDLSSGECEALFDSLEITYENCTLPDGNPAPPQSHNLSEISPDCELEELAELFLQEYEGENGFLGHLKGVKTCADPAMGQVIQKIIELEMIFSGLNNNLGFATWDCVYQNQMLDKEITYKQCSSFSDFADAAKISLKNKIEEMSMLFDESCNELEALKCIGLGTYLGQSGLILENFGKKFDRFGETLAENKSCGIQDLYIDPDRDYIISNETTLLQAIARDKDGNILHNREVIWGKDESDAVTMVANPQTALITGNKNGNSLIEAMDAISQQAIVSTNIPGAGNILTIPIITGFNINTSFINVGWYVELNPSKLTLIPPELMTVTATLYDSFGQISVPAGYHWESSDEEIVVVEGYGSFSSLGRLTPVGLGVATIAATEIGTGLNATAKVVVGARIKVTPQETCLPMFESEQLSATVEDLEGQKIQGIDPYDIVWYSPDSSTVSVNIDGFALAKSEGEVQIEASYKNNVGFSLIRVPSFPIDYRVTPVYLPQYIERNGKKWHAQPVLNDYREVVDILKLGFEIKDQCGVEIEDHVVTMAGLKMNNNGQFVGKEYYDDRGWTGFVFDTDKCEDIAVVNYPGAYYTELVSINDNGQAVGNAYLKGWGSCYPDLSWEVSSQPYPCLDDLDRDYAYHKVAFLYDLENETIQTLIPPGNWSNVAVKDINNEGEIIGEVNACFEPDRTPCPWSFEKVSEAFSFIYANGIFTVLPAFYSNYYFSPTAINDKGVVVGGVAQSQFFPYAPPPPAFYNVYYQDQYLAIHPPFPSTMPVQHRWFFNDINNQDDILIDSQPGLRDFISVMHLCPLK